MRVLYVIDNQAHLMADVLGALLRAHAARSLDIATAYFTLPGFCSVIEQEERFTDILNSVEEQRTRGAAPRSLDPVQQTVAISIQGYLSHPAVERAMAVKAIKFVSQPMRRMQITRLRAVFREFQRTGTIQMLLDAINDIRAQFGEASAVPPVPNHRSSVILTRDD